MKKKTEETRARMFACWSELAERFDPADLPADEAWKNDLNAIIDGMSEDGLNDIKRGMILGPMKIADSGLPQNAADPAGDIDFVVPTTLYDTMCAAAGFAELVEAAQNTKAFDPMSLVNRFKLRGKDDVN